MSARQKAALAALEQFHRSVDAAAGRLVEIHRDRLLCRKGCSACCEDALSVLTLEADLLREKYPELLQLKTAGPMGACAFLDEEKGCRVYPHRPYVCRTQGLPLRWVEEGAEDEWIEYRDICPLNENDEPIEELNSEDFWELGPFEGQLARLQQEWVGHQKREPLRSLFKNPALEMTKSPNPKAMEV